MSQDVKLERLIPLVVPLKGDGVDTCIICDRRLGCNSRQIHIVEGGAFIAHPSYEYSDTAADVGWHSIGPECARLFPHGFAVVMC